MLEIEKMESKKLETFHKLLEWIISVESSAQSEQAEEIFTWKLTTPRTR